MRRQQAAACLALVQDKMISKAPPAGYLKVSRPRTTDPVFAALGISNDPFIVPDCCGSEVAEPEALDF